MTLTLNAARELFRAGRFVDLVQQAVRANDLRLPPNRNCDFFLRTPFSTLPTRPLLSESRNSKTSHQPHLTSRAYCEQVLGLLRRRQGAIGQARNHFQTAIQIANESRDQKRTAWASLHLFRTLAESEAAAAIAGMLPEVRKVVARAGDVQIAAYLHDSIALMEVANGRLNEARRHIKLARSLLESDPNAWLQQVVEVSSFFVAFLENNYAAASDHLKRARRLLPITGDQDRFLIECNEAHALIITGKYQAALRRLDAVADSSSVRPALAALEGMARAYLAIGTLDKCDLALARYEEGVAKDPGIENGIRRSLDRSHQGQIASSEGLGR